MHSQDKLKTRHVNQPGTNTPTPSSTDDGHQHKDTFHHLATLASAKLGSKWAFAGACGVVVLWGISGPIFHFSDSWQLVINTGTTVVTFLMVFLIQNTQNRDANAMNLKLDELIRATDRAGKQMIDIESLSDLDLEALHSKYEKIKIQVTKSNTTTPGQSKP